MSEGDFDQALRWLKAGKRVRLPGWDHWLEMEAGKILHVCLAEYDELAVDFWEWRPTNSAYLIREDWEVVE